MVWVLTDAGSGAAAGYHPIIVLVSSSTPKKHRSSMVAMLFLLSNNSFSRNRIKSFQFPVPSSELLFSNFLCGTKICGAYIQNNISNIDTTFVYNLKN